MVRDNPFPHIVWDSFLDKETLSSIEQEFPHEESDFWTWKSNDEKNASEEKAAAALIYFWNKSQNETFNLDLWTKEMSVEEMNKMMFQMIMTIANTYERATSEDQIALAMRDFAEFFGEKTGVIPKTGKFEPDGKG